MYVVLSVAASLDGYIDDASDERLLLSNAEDFARVDRIRADADAILVGANTIRADDPRLLVRSEQYRREREAAGRGSSPTKVTVTNGGELNPDARFFTTGECAKLVYVGTAAAHATADRLGAAATVVDAGDPVEVHQVLADLARRGIQRLLVEGGGEMHTAFLTADLVDELHLVYAPFFIGDPNAPSFVRAAAFPQSQHRPMRLLEALPIGDLVLLRYRVRGA
ncbi:5-amino-6-(5-phosphoribosylamino)uracil reductase [Tamaricihabitans halophyticus]|uniref:5-amino-6-(5-phosphoribosylamino)uracil reductase n=1 Tax=Tamaricihabitans halophyticus TaxID=1262583 RepID=A0A4R2QH22_9PSEU|nr:dihydrofolate reductase family protein [Tamaricihabitans halophyticus]TCP47874.1 5-amino-6-(5-phosphoribosylamino)uracil reductase [Tamaricihabitans halophyticus]